MAEGKTIAPMGEAWEYKDKEFMKNLLLSDP